MKKALFVLLIAVIMLTFCGCAEVVYSVYPTASGGRIMEWTVTLQADQVALAGGDVVQAVRNLMQQEADYRVERGRNARVEYDESNPLVIKLVESYDSLTDMYIAFGYTGFEQNEAVEKKPISLLFAEVENELQFVSQEDVDSVAGIFAQYYFYYNVSVESVSLKYKYGTSYNTVYGVNHDQTYTEGNINFYVWNIDVTDVDSVRLLVAQRIPRLWVWESIAIAAGLLVIAALTVVIVINRRRKTDA